MHRTLESLQQRLPQRSILKLHRLSENLTHAYYTPTLRDSENRKPPEAE